MTNFISRFSISALLNPSLTPRSSTEPQLLSPHCHVSVSICCWRLFLPSGFPNPHKSMNYWCAFVLFDDIGRETRVTLLAWNVTALSVLSHYLRSHFSLAPLTASVSWEGCSRGGKRVKERQLMDGRTRTDGGGQRAERYRERRGRLICINSTFWAKAARSMRNFGRVLSLSLLNVFSSKMSIPSGEMDYRGGQSTFQLKIQQILHE